MKYLVSIISVIVLLSSCSKSDPTPQPPVPSTKNTVLVYLSADSDFLSEVPYKVGYLRNNWKKDYDGNLLVYADGGSEATLIHIYSDYMGVTNQDTLKTYPAQNSADTEIMSSIMSYVYSTWPADNKGLVLLSHATGWLPKGMLLQPRSVVQDKSDYMELPEFAAALPVKLDYALFDACLMGGIEVAYELAGKIDRLIVSPAEVLVDNTFIYPTMMGRMMQSTPDLEGLADDFFKYFAENNSTSRQSVTVSLIDTRKMGDLAALSKEILGGRDIESLVTLGNIQQYYPSSYLYTDLGHLVEVLAPERNAAYKSALDKCVLYKNCTNRYFSAGNRNYNPINVDKYSGLTLYVPQARYPILNAALLDTKWGKYIFGE